MSVKYWVSELSDSAIDNLKKECYNILISYGHEYELINDFINDIENEKLMNLEELISHERMKELSVMEWMGFLNDLHYSFKKTLKVYGFNNSVINSSSYLLYDDDSILFSFNIIDNNLTNVEKYIIHTHNCTIDKIKKLNDDLILFSVIDENLKANTLILKKT